MRVLVNCRDYWFNMRIAIIVQYEDRNHDGLRLYIIQLIGSWGRLNCLQESNVHAVVSIVLL